MDVTMNMMTEQKLLISGFGAKTTAEEALAGRDLRGEVAIVTGGHVGLGLETTRVLSNAGATVVIGSRDTQKARKAPILPADSKLRSGVRPWAVDKAAAEALWVLSEKLTSISRS
jgi:short-subunit dehydrogenase